MCRRRQCRLPLCRWPECPGGRRRGRARSPGRDPPRGRPPRGREGRTPGDRREGGRRAAVQSPARGYRRASTRSRLRRGLAGVSTGSDVRAVTHARRTTRARCPIAGRDTLSARPHRSPGGNRLHPSTLASDETEAGGALRDCDTDRPADRAGGVIGGMEALPAAEFGAVTRRHKSLSSSGLWPLSQSPPGPFGHGTASAWRGSRHEHVTVTCPRGCSYVGKRNVS